MDMMDAEKRRVEDEEVEKMYAAAAEQIVPPGMEVVYRRRPCDGEPMPYVGPGVPSLPGEQLLTAKFIKWVNWEDWKGEEETEVPTGGGGGGEVTAAAAAAAEASPIADDSGVFVSLEPETKLLGMDIAEEEDDDDFDGFVPAGKRQKLA
eukprot:TRINITY_DN9887_c0_g2_i2.p2 TRINITY_DN9887_c0_g2~~TRINITY_DN9887_c0_g2_i2.p2  ORF type:complete len:150 (+),score=46.59 TRINITY_DN9887_c0_g2_i2:67-516(+)